MKPHHRLIPRLVQQGTFTLMALLLGSALAARAQAGETPEAQSAAEPHKPGIQAEGQPEAKQPEAKEPEGKEGEAKEEAERPEPPTDLTVFLGSDFVRPGLLPRANLNLAIGHKFHFLRRNPLGSKLTFGYTYENTGTHGFFHTQFGEHTEQLGFLRDIRFGHSERVSGYTIVQAGISSLTGDKVQNRFSTSPGTGLITHFSRSQSLWLQELYNKVDTVPWYTVSSVGYTYSF